MKLSSVEFFVVLSIIWICEINSFSDKKLTDDSKIKSRSKRWQLVWYPYNSCIAVNLSLIVRFCVKYNFI